LSSILTNFPKRRCFHIDLSSFQIKQLSSCISIYDVKKFIEENKESYEKWLQEEENKT